MVQMLRAAVGQSVIPTRGHIWVALLSLPRILVVVVAFMLVLSSILKLLRTRARHRRLRICQLRQSSVSPELDRPPRALEERVIGIKVLSTLGSVKVLIDKLVPGEVLLKRARSCVVGRVDGLVLRSGVLLDPFQSLAAQGLRDGDVVTEVGLKPRPPSARPGGPERELVREPERTPERRSVELRHFTFDQHISEVTRDADYFEMQLIRKREPEALAEAALDTVEAVFLEHTLSLKIRGAKTDFVYKRRIGIVPEKCKEDALQVGFPLCSCRCTCDVQPGRRITLTLRPYPEGWLPPGTSVEVQGLKFSPELNGLRGSVAGYVEREGKFQPARYAVQLNGQREGGSQVVRVQRANLVSMEDLSQSYAPRPDMFYGDLFPDDDPGENDDDYAGPVVEEIDDVEYDCVQAKNQLRGRPRAR